MASYAFQALCAPINVKPERGGEGGVSGNLRKFDCDVYPQGGFNLIGIMHLIFQFK